MQGDDGEPDKSLIVRGGTGAITDAQRELLDLDRRADEAAAKAVPANTRRAYELELACFVSWCGRRGVSPSPAEPRVVRAYLHELGETGRDARDVPSKRKPKGPLGYSAIERALAAICRSLQEQGHPSIWKHPLIEKELDTWARMKGTAPKKQKRDLSGVGEELIFRVCDAISDDVRGLRDRAMLLVGWQGGGRRRSEIAAARVEHFEPIDDGYLWRIPRSKADQTGKGLTVKLKLSSDEKYCAVRALRRWLEVAKIDQGPVFRGVDMTTGSVMAAALAPQGVARRVQFYAKKIGLDPSDFGGHSLRSGFVSTAYRTGMQVPDIMEATGHRNPNEVYTYIRRLGLDDSPASGLIDEAIARRKPPKEPPP